MIGDPYQGRCPVTDEMALQGMGGQTMKIMQSLFILILLVGLWGCMSQTVLLRNDKGETVKCEANAGPIDDCIKQKEAAGYKRVEEPETPRMPMGGSGY